jgi:hypothetical protein
MYHNGSVGSEQFVCQFAGSSTVKGYVEKWYQEVLELDVKAVVVLENSKYIWDGLFWFGIRANSGYSERELKQAQWNW